MKTPVKKRWHVGCGNGEKSVFADEGRMALGPGGTTLTPICTVYDFEGDREENLRLIAAAPRLLAVLEETLSSLLRFIPREARGYAEGCFKYTMGGTDICKCSCSVCNARRAIASAKLEPTECEELDPIDTATGESRR